MLLGSWLLADVGTQAHMGMHSWPGAAQGHALLWPCGAIGLAHLLRYLEGAVPTEQSRVPFARAVQWRPPKPLYQKLVLVANCLLLVACGKDFPAHARQFDTRAHHMSSVHVHLCVSKPPSLCLLDAGTGLVAAPPAVAVGGSSYRQLQSPRFRSHYASPNHVIML